MANSQGTPSLDAPPSNNVVRVRMLDTTGVMVLHSEFFVKPVVPGHETMNMTVAAFLIENERLGRKAMFDLGIRKDYWNLPPAIQTRLDWLATGMRIDKDVKDILEEKNISLDSINDIIWSHSHWDHTGDTTLFPSTTNLVYGPDLASSVTPGYPTDPSSPVPENHFENRKNIEISFPPDGLKIGGYPAHDFYGDGSFYLLSTPGHAPGHMCGLARTTPDTFILMGGDVCHFTGDLRPNKSYPLPDPIPDNTLEKEFQHPTPCPASFFLDEHPHVHHHLSSSSSPSTSQNNKPNPSTTPYYLLSTSTKTAYSTPSTAVAQTTVNTLSHTFDSNPKVLVLIAHDTALFLDDSPLPTLNNSTSPESDLNNWYERGWKDQTYWGWLNEVARKGGKGRKDIVDGFWKGGRRFDTAEEAIEDARRNGEGREVDAKKKGEGEGEGEGESKL